MDLSIFQVRRLRRIRVDEPGVDIVSSVDGITFGAGEGPCHGVVEYGVGHGFESTGVVDKQPV